LLIIFTFYCLNNVSYATNWVEATIDKSGTLYVDIDNITYKENRITFWLKATQKKPISNTYKNQIIKHNESKYQYIADCLTKKVSTVIAYFYLNGKHVHTLETDEKDFTPIPPDSTIRKVLDQLCENYKRNKFRQFY